jgi:hypothetical protein
MAKPSKGKAISVDMSGHISLKIIKKTAKLSSVGVRRGAPEV